MSPKLLQDPKTLKEYINQYQENRKLIDIKEKTVKEPTFIAFLSSYIADVVAFVTGILSVILTFVITYMLCRQSKLKSLVANMSLQCIKTIEATAIKEIENCDFGIIKLLIIGLMQSEKTSLMTTPKCLGTQIFRWTLRYTPQYLSDEVTNIQCEMKYPDNLSDIPPTWNCQW